MFIAATLQPTKKPKKFNQIGTKGRGFFKGLLRLYSGRMYNKVSVSLLLVLLSLAGCIHCWGVDGHQIVAQIASAFITPTTNNAVQRMLNGFSLANISTWPDNYDHTSEGQWSERFHFVDLDSNAINFTYASCFRPGEPPGCVITAISNATGNQTLFTGLSNFLIIGLLFFLKQYLNKILESIIGNHALTLLIPLFLVNYLSLCIFWEMLINHFM